MDLKFEKKDFSSHCAQSSGAMKKIFKESPTAAKDLDSSYKQGMFYETLRKHQGSKYALQETLGELRAKHSAIGFGGTTRLGKALISHGKRFIYPAKNSSPEGKSAPAAPQFQARIREQVQSGIRPQIQPESNVRNEMHMYAKKNFSILHSGIVKNLDD